MSRVLDLRDSTAASGAPADGRALVFETTLVETLGIRKFVEMSIADIRQQLEAAALAAKTPRERKLFLAQKQNGYVITAWLTSALMTIDAMLADCAAKSEAPLAEQLKEDN